MPFPTGGAAGVLRRLVYRTHFALACVFGGLSFFVLATLALLHYALFRNGERAAMVWIRGFGVAMTRFLGWRVQVENLDTVRDASGSVVVGNHQSNLDIATWATFFPRRSVAVGKKEIEKIPVFGWLWRVSKNVLIDRSNPEKAKESLAAAAERIRNEGLNVWVLPEGHRNSSPEMLPFKKGAFHLAIAAQVPVIPFATSPMGTVLDARRWLVRPGLVRVRVLAPISTEGMTEADLERLLQASRASIDGARRDLIATAGLPIG